MRPQIRRSSERATHDLTAYDLYLRALPHCFSFERTRITYALDLLGQAIERDPGCGPALVLAAVCHTHLEVNGWVDDVETAATSGLILLGRHSKSPPTIHTSSAMLPSYSPISAKISMYRFVGRPGLALNPSFAHGWYWSGVLRIWRGRPDLALEHLQTFLRLSPRDRLPVHMTSIGAALFFNRRFEEAAATLLESLERAPNFGADISPSRVMLCASWTAGRRPRGRQPTARNHPYRGGGGDAVSEAGTPRAVAVGSALGHQSGGLIPTRRSPCCA